MDLSRRGLFGLFGLAAAAPKLLSEPPKKLLKFEQPKMDIEAVKESLKVYKEQTDYQYEDCGFVMIGDVPSGVSRCNPYVVQLTGRLYRLTVMATTPPVDQTMEIHAGCITGKRFPEIERETFGRIPGSVVVGPDADPKAIHLYEYPKEDCSLWVCNYDKFAPELAHGLGIQSTMLNIEVSYTVTGPNPQPAKDLSVGIWWRFPNRGEMSAQSAIEELSKGASLSLVSHPIAGGGYLLDFKSE